jgi:tetratricopeptide (TPR) repeat protein
MANGKQEANPRNVTPAPAQTASRPAPTSNPYFTGDGGKGKSLAILAPRATGLAKNQEYLPALVQGELVSIFTGHSAISVLDREHLDEQYAELLSSYYDDNTEERGDLGHLRPTDYIMDGGITKTATGYALQMRITRTADKMTEASYSGTCSFVELDNLTAIRRASLDLLLKMGVALTEGARMELAGAAAASHVNAQTALAQGITAQRQGAEVEALYYYYQAASFEPALREASVLAAQVTGGLGVTVQNDIQARRTWLNLLKDCAAFMKDHPPFELVYDPKIEQDGPIDYVKETASFAMHIALSPSVSGFKVINDLLTGLDKTGRRSVWGFEGWPFLPLNPAVPEALIWDGKRSFTVSGEAALVNADGKILGKAQFSLTSGEAGYGSGERAVTAPVAAAQILRFANVNANDLSDPLAVRILNVNGKSAEAAGEAGYLRIAADTAGLARREWDRVTEEAITVPETARRLLYSLSNNPAAIERAIAARTDETLDLDTVTWRSNTSGLSASVKNLMNKHSVNYSMTAYTTGEYRYILVNKRAGNEWHIFSAEPALTPTARYSRSARAYNDNGEHDRAIADAAQAIRLDSSNASAYFQRAFAYSRKTMYSEAIADYTQAIRLEPTDAIAYSNRAYAYSSKGMHDEAISDCNQAIRLDPNYATAYIRRGNAYYSKKMYTEAISDCNQAIKLDPNNAGVHVTRGNAYHQKGNRTQARADWNRALQLDPNSTAARNNLERL